MSNIIVMLIFFIILLGLEIFLSLQKNKWLGLILPVLYLGFAFLLTFGNPILSNLGSVIITYLLMAIPAVLNFVIYLACRARVKDKNTSELKKMNIQDLN